MSNPDDKWAQPAAPPAPMFFGQKERNLVKQVNDELAERVIGQTVLYYPISLENTNFHPLYGEAINKTFLPPIRVYAYVVVDDEQTNDKYSYEYKSKYVRPGDFVQYGDLLYEIANTYNDTRYYFGQVDYKFQITADCIRACRGTFRGINDGH